MMKKKHLIALTGSCAIIIVALINLLSSKGSESNNITVISGGTGNGISNNKNSQITIHSTSSKEKEDQKN